MHTKIQTARTTQRPRNNEVEKRRKRKNENVKLHRIDGCKAMFEQLWAFQVFKELISFYPYCSIYRPSFEMNSTLNKLLNILDYQFVFERSVALFFISIPSFYNINLTGEHTFFTRNVKLD